MINNEPVIEPPKWADRFLEWFCASHLLDEIQGDLYEAHYHRSKTLGHRRANLLFVLDVFKFLKPSNIKKGKNSNTIDMHKNYLKIAYRNFLQYKGYSSINLFGLVVGIVSCLLISIHVIEEMSYDNFHPDSENTYRLVMDMYSKGELAIKSAPVFAAVGPNLVKDYPEILEQVRILPFGQGVYSVTRPDGSLVRFNEERAVFADANFFQMFGFELVDGNPAEVLNDKKEIVISESTAKRYFGNEYPIGKTITYRGESEVVVSGIMKDFPENSHMQFDMITSLSTWDGFETFDSEWGWYDFYTFIRTPENTNSTLLGNKIATYLDEKKKESFERSNARQELVMQPIRDVHLHSKGYSWEMGQNGGANQVYFLMAIAGLILVIAWVNFINLSTARAVKRAKEVGLRKVVGAKKMSLVNQFLTEALFYNFTAVAISIGLAMLLIPLINRVLDITLETEILYSLQLIVGTIILVLTGTIISGLYPAFVLTSFSPIQVLKGNFYNRRSKFGFRQVLVVFQFSISIVLILGTILVVKQLRFMQSQDLGLNVKQTLVVKGPSASRGGEDDLRNRRQLFTSKLKQIPAASGFTVSNVVPGVENFSISRFVLKSDNNVNGDCYRVSTDANYFDDFDIEILAGRNFNPQLASDSSNILLNLEAVRLFGLGSPEKALGQVITSRQQEWKIIGVVENYHHSSLKESLDPIAFFYNDRWGNFYSIKLAQENIPLTIGAIEDLWDEVFPDNPFEFFFLDEYFNRQYQSEQRFNAVFQGFATLAIIVACLGLFGLVSFTTEQGRKEIGIRKVLGASVIRIVLLFAKDYAILVLIAMAIAFPTGYYLMKLWLQDFAYQTTIGIPIFIIGGLIIAVIAFLTVSFKSVAAAKANPVGALRDE